MVAALYLAVAFATVAVLGPAADTSRAPLADLLAYGPGGARQIAAAMAVLLTAGVLNAYYAGAAKLGAALARDAALPGWLAGGSAAGEVPRRSLAALAAMSLASFAVVESTALDVRPLVLLTSAQLATVYAVGIAAALRLLPRGTPGTPRRDRRLFRDCRPARRRRPVPRLAARPRRRHCALRPPKRVTEARRG